MVQWWQIVIIIVCVLLSGTFSGLTLGLMSLDLTDLNVLRQSGTEREKWCAERILPVRRHANWLLCTLLIGNTAVNSALSIVTSDLFGGIIGFLSSTMAILYAGEIIPQALCHRFGLVIGAYSIPIVKFFMFVTAPLSFLTAKIIDYFLGGEPTTRYSRSQLKSLLSMHARNFSDVDLFPTSHDDSPHQETIDMDSPFITPVRDTVVDVSPSPQHTDSNNPEFASESATPQNFNSPRKGSLSPIKRNSILGSGLGWISWMTSSICYNKKRNRIGKSTSGSAEEERNSQKNILSKEEMQMLGGAFDFGQKKVGMVMTALENVFMLEHSVSIDFGVLLEIFQAGHSRIPVYSKRRENIIGMLFSKDLILLDPEDSIPIRTMVTFFDREILSVTEDTRLDKMLNIFCQGKGHMSLVRKSDSCSPTTDSVGVVTLEDLIEELIGKDIVDETDVYTDNLNKQRVKRSRSIDPEMLKIFDSKHYCEKLSQNEVTVIHSFLCNNVIQFSEELIRPDFLQEMLSKIPVIEFRGNDKRVDPLSPTVLFSQDPESKKSRSQGLVSRTNSKHDLIDDLVSARDVEGESRILYEKGVPADCAYLIIHGSVMITVGADGFVSHAGPWTFLGLESLTNCEYTPDFTAEVLDNPVRLLRFPRNVYASLTDSTETGK